MPMALDTSSLQPIGQLQLNGPLIIAICAGVIVAIVLVVVAVLLSKKRAVLVRDNGSDIPIDTKEAWLERVDNVAADATAGTITREEAFARLAAIARTFASSRSPQRFDSYTLLDLNRENTHDNTDNWIALRQTIAALYPPEFADKRHHPIAKDATVDQACDWVRSFIERWH